MSSLKWLVQKNLLKEEVLEQFRAAFQQLSIDFEEVQVIPFSPDLPTFSPADVTIFYGSTSLMINASKHPEFRRGVFYNSEKFQMHNYLKHWGEKMLNADGRVLTFGEFVSSKIDKQQDWFLRPNEDTKSFAGTVMSATEIATWFEKIQKIDNPDLNAETLIFVSSVKKINREWRNFLVNGKVVDSSRYAVNGDLAVSPTDVPADMIAFSESCAKDYSPADIYVLDIAETDQGYKIIECNCFNGTGFYKHDITKIVEAITIQCTQSLINKT